MHERYLLTRREWHAGACLAEVCPYLTLLHLRVIDVDKGPFLLEVFDKGDGSRLASVTCVCLESETKNSNALQRGGKIKFHE